MSNDSQRIGVEAERSVTGPFTGAVQNVGTPLANPPVIIIFDNQSTVAVPLSVNGVLWKTFSAGQCFVMDCRANHGIAANFTWDQGTQFTLTATGGTGAFRISTTYAR